MVVYFVTKVFSWVFIYNLFSESDSKCLRREPGCSGPCVIHELFIDNLLAPEQDSLKDYPFY